MTIKHITNNEHTTGINLIMHPYPAMGAPTKTIWVVITNSLDSTCMEWFLNEQDASEEFECVKKNAPAEQVQCCLFPFNVDEKATAEQITQAIDDFYDRVELSRDFNFSDLVQFHPFAPDVWQGMLDKHSKPFPEIKTTRLSGTIYLDLENTPPLTLEQEGLTMEENQNRVTASHLDRFNQQGSFGLRDINQSCGFGPKKTKQTLEEWLNAGLVAAKPDNNRRYEVTDAGRNFILAN